MKDHTKRNGGCNSPNLVRTLTYSVIGVLVLHVFLSVSFYMYVCTL